MNWPQIPETLKGLDSKALRALADSINEARSENLSKVTSPEEQAEYAAMTAKERAIRELAVDAHSKEVADAAQAAADAAAAAAVEAAAAGPDDGDDAGGDEPDDGNDTSAGEDGDDTEASTKSPVTTLSTSTGVSTTERVETAAPSVSAYPWVYGPDSPEGKRGKPFTDHNELAMQVLALGEAIDAGSDRKHVVATLPTTRPLTELSLDNPLINLAKFDSPQEITAAMCPPLQPLYDLACDNVVRRPVQAGLPQFGIPAMRGGFKVLPSPSLFDITGGFGQWTSDDDSDPEAIKSACQTVTCSTPTDYEWYGIYRCLTVKNMVYMTFPELVNAFLNRLQARAARYAEILLLEAMNNGSDTIEVDRRYGYGASTSVVRTILNYLALYQEIERWDAGTMDAWMPRWLRYGIKMDMASMNRSDGGKNRVPSDAEVDALFRDAGFEPHWYIDRPSWATAIPNLQTAGDLNYLPNSVEILVHKRGKFALMDRGELTIGVTGNNMYRLEDDLRKNQFTFFYESFEGLIDTDSCPAHVLQLRGLCYTGHQIADQLIACEGGRVDSGGAAS
jgi:hypothetical protein